MARKSNRKTPEQRREQARELQASITEQVAAMANSDAWQRYLEFARAFHAYSFNNLLLIMSQRPDATQVAGFRKWKQLGRQVRKGERGIRIFGYAQKKVTDESDRDENDNPTEKTITYYPILTVFDVGQTDPIEGADPLPEPPSQRLDGDDPHGLYTACAQWLYAQGWKIEREPIGGQTDGYTTRDGSHRVVVDANLSDADAAATLLHEAAHVILHTDEPAAEYVTHRGIKETEAESVAYIVAGIHGLDTAACTIGYVAGWSDGNTDTIKQTAQRVLSAADQLSEAINTHLVEADTTEAA